MTVRADPAYRGVALHLGHTARSWIAEQRILAAGGR